MPAHVPPAQPKESSLRSDPGTRGGPSITTNLLLLALTLTLPLAGCSWFAVKPAKIDGRPNPACTTSRMPPAMDVGAAAGLGTTMAIGAANGSGTTPGYVVLGLGAALLVGSAMYGLSNVNACAAAHPEGWDPDPADPDALVDPDSRPKKKKPPTRLVPEPGVMRSN